MYPTGSYSHIDFPSFNRHSKCIYYKLNKWYSRSKEILLMRNIGDKIVYEVYDTGYESFQGDEEK